MTNPRPHASRAAARTRLRRLLVREGSYAAIASAAPLLLRELAHEGHWARRLRTLGR